MFADSHEKLEQLRKYTLDFLQQKGLVVNTDKEDIFKPHTPWTFLGIQYCDGVVDLSPVTIKKLKDKIRRKARSLYRWQNRKNVSTEKTIKVMLKIFNRKFYEQHHVSELTWSRWFFPMITTSKGLKQIDNYLVQYLRYIPTGKHNKLNYNTRYNYLKSLGYKSLVNEFYKYREAETKTN